MQIINYYMHYLQHVGTGICDRIFHSNFMLHCLSLLFDAISIFICKRIFIIPPSYQSLSYVCLMSVFSLKLMVSELI